VDDHDSSTFGWRVMPATATAATIGACAWRSWQRLYGVIPAITELCFPGPDGWPDFFCLLKAAFSSRGDELAYAFDLLHLNGQDLKPPTADREPATP
jgi:hypothetical protein